MKNYFIFGKKLFNKNKTKSEKVLPKLRFSQRSNYGPYRYRLSCQREVHKSKKKSGNSILKEKFKKKSEIIQKKNIVLFKRSQETMKKQIFKKKKISNSKLFLKVVKKNKVKQINEFIFQKYEKVQQQDEEGNHLSHFAVWHGNVKLVKYLLQQGLDFDLTNKDQISPLMLASAQQNLGCIKLLKNKIKNINQRDFQGNTALHYAVAKESVEIFKELLSFNKINPYIKNKSNKICLDLAHPRVLIKMKSILIDFDKQKQIKLQDFIIHSKIGKGSFGQVYLAETKTENQYFAIKVLEKKLIKQQKLQKYVLTERNVMSSLRHPFIVKLKRSFQSDNYLFLVMDYCPGGDLSYYLEKEGQFTEKRSKFYISEIILAIEELHLNNIIFRDLKPENIVLDKEGHVQLIDFGLSKENIFSNKLTKSFCGSIAYLAPEMVKKKGHGKEIDWYMLGVLLYEMLVGIPPFYDDSKKKLFSNIKKNKPKFPHYFSEDLKDFLGKLLIKNPKKRLGSGGVKDIKKHQWFQDINWDKVYNKKLKMTKPFAKKIKLFSIKRPKCFDDNQFKHSIKNWTFIDNQLLKEIISFFIFYQLKISFNILDMKSSLVKSIQISVLSNVLIILFWKSTLLYN